MEAKKTAQVRWAGHKGVGQQGLCARMCPAEEEGDVCEGSGVRPSKRCEEGHFVQVRGGHLYWCVCVVWCVWCVLCVRCGVCDVWCGVCGVWYVWCV